MFTATIIGAFVLAHILWQVLEIVFIDKSKIIYKNILKLDVATAVYLFAAGVYLIFDWSDPLSTMSSEQYAKGSATHGGKGGILLSLISYWPHFLIAYSSYYLYGLWKDGDIDFMIKNNE